MELKKKIHLVFENILLYFKENFIQFLRLFFFFENFTQFSIEFHLTLRKFH